MILVIASIRTSRQSFSELVGNGSISLEVFFYFMINFMISVSVAKVKVFIKKIMSEFIIVWKFCSNNSNFINKKV